MTFTSSIDHRPHAGDGSDYAKLISEEYHKKCAEPDSRKFFDEVNKWAAEMCRVEIDTTPQLRGICGKGELEFRRFVSRVLWSVMPSLIVL